MSSDELTEEVEHDPGFLAVLLTSIEGLWDEGGWYRLALLVITGVALTAVTGFMAALALEVLPL